jgi:hypothetical protein
VGCLFDKDQEVDAVFIESSLDRFPL